ncbi:MAG: methylamine utilization protein [Planctomycetota bacterium]|nr:methylamine utilization protein [Planctomycetota bacterium]
MTLALPFLFAALAAQVAGAGDVAPKAAEPARRLVDQLDATQVQRILRHGPLEPAPPDPTNRVATSDAAAHLGQRLFYDTRLSLDGNHSCTSCHMTSRAFADGLDLPVPAGASERHSPTILNAVYQRWFFWDGRADSLWSQALQPIENPRELGIGRAGLARLLVEDTRLAAEYRAAFDEAPSAAPEDSDRTAVNAAKAIAAYEARLVSADSAFDRFAAALRAGDLDAAARYPEDALRGLLLFTGRANCRSCHAGPLFSDGEFHTIGMPPKGGGKLRDSGRFRGIELLRADPFRGSGPWSDAPDSERAREVESLVQSPEQWGQVRTPSLRNVARTAPYMSQGQMASLRDVLHYYSTLDGAVAAGHHGEQVLKPLALSDGERADLEAFLRTLDGVDPPAALMKPLPKAR